MNQDYELARWSPARLRTGIRGIAGTFDVERPGPLCIYTVLLAFFLLQAVFFARHIPLGHPPDEIAHLSYVLHMEQHGYVLPHPETSHLFAPNGHPTKTLNYLAHPPLYYLLMSGFAPADAHVAWHDYRTLRYVNIAIVGIGLMLYFWLGYRADMPDIYHLWFGIAITSIPMIPYLAGAINNDNLAFTGFAVLFAGAVLLMEGRVAANYLLALGVILTFLTKATVGLQAAFFGGILLILWLWTKHGLRQLLSRHSIVVGISLSLVVAYYVYVKVVYNSFIPAAGHIAWHGGHGPRMSLSVYVHHFFKALWLSYSGILSNGKNIFKDDLAEGFSLLAIPVLAIAGLIIGKVWKRQYVISGNERQASLFLAAKAGTAATAAFMVAHFLTVHATYMKTFYPGGIQGRYYFPLLPPLIICAFISLRKYPRNILTMLVVGILALGFIYANWYFFMSRYFLHAWQAGLPELY